MIYVNLQFKIIVIIKRFDCLLWLWSWRVYKKKEVEKEELEAQSSLLYEHANYFSGRFTSKSHSWRKVQISFFHYYWCYILTASLIFRDFRKKSQVSLGVFIFIISFNQTGCFSSLCTLNHSEVTFFTHICLQYFNKSFFFSADGRKKLLPDK